MWRVYFGPLVRFGKPWRAAAIYECDYNTQTMEFSAGAGIDWWQYLVRGARPCA